MELVTEPDIYSPSIDEIGNYVDKVPSFITIKNGIRCLCGSRKNKVYDTHSIFSNHVKSKTHQKWLSNLNLNKANYYIKNEELNTILQQQKIIIARLEKDLQNKIMTIDFLTQQLSVKNEKTVDNLIDFD
jgi:hypothetical protein